MKYDVQLKFVNQRDNSVVEKSIGGRKFKVPISSKLTVDMFGKNMHTIIANTIRRVCLDNIPTYAFPSENIKITINNTIENNDTVRLTLSQVPIISTSCDLIYMHPRYWRADIVDYNDQARERHPDELQINIDINYHNNSNEIYNLTTNNIKYYQDGVEIPNKYNTECPILLSQLRPSESFACNMRATLGTGERHNIFSAVNTCYYDDNTYDPVNGQVVDNKDNRVTLFIESSGQTPESVILLKAIKYIQKRLLDIEEELKAKKLGDHSTVVIDFENDDHTMGELINYAFQDHDDIKFSGCSKPDHLVTNIRITTISKGNKSPLGAMYEQLGVLGDLFKDLEKTASSLVGKSAEHIGAIKDKPDKKTKGKK